MRTPSPWKKFHLRRGHATGNGQIEIQGPDGLTLVAYIPTEGDNPRGFRARKDNAEFIVKACNNHDPLVQATKDCLADLKHYVATHGPGPDKRLAALERVLLAIETDEILDEIDREESKRK